LEVFNKSDARKTKAAVIVSPTDKALEGYKFYETVTEILVSKPVSFLKQPQRFNGSRQILKA
jgi:hypothetical protein